MRKIIHKTNKYLRPKGLSDIFWTLILLIVILVMIIMGTFIWLQIHLPGFSTADPISYSIDFVHIANKPFLIAQVLSHVRFDDRQLLEQSIESMATSLEDAQATKLPENIDTYIATYDLKEYSVSIRRASDAYVLHVESTELKCGDTAENPEGWCVFGECGVGRVEISPTELKCLSAWQKCCKEDKEEYLQEQQKKPAEERKNWRDCGPNGEGVCSTGSRPVWAKLYEISGTAYKYSCEQNRIDLGNLPECKDANNGATRACCAPKTEEIEISRGIATKATIPLLYRQYFGILEVTAR